MLVSNEEFTLNPLSMSIPCTSRTVRPRSDSRISSGELQHIQDRRKIYLLVLYLDFSNVCCPLLVRCSCNEVSVYDVWSNLAYLTLIRLIFSLLSLTIQAHLYHKFLHCLMVKSHTIIAQLRGYSSIAITTFMMIIYLTDCSPGIVIAVRL